MKKCLTFIISIVAMCVWLGNEISFAKENEKTILNYTRLGVNDSGETYFEEESIELNLWPSGLAMVSLTEPSESIRYFKATPGWQMLDLHYAPKRQYLLVLQGVLEIHTSTEQIKQFKQGSILLVEDTYGKGHRTRNAGNEDLVLVWVGVQK
jgi:mannose-6-phosphate isomerase-like protein (cupin superfamily)